MIEINLIPDVKQELIKAQRIRATVITLAIIISLIAAAIVTVLAIWVFGVQTVRQNLADDAIKKGNSQLQSNADLSKVLTIQNQLTKITALNNSKNLDSRIFDVLAAIIPPSPNQIQISDLSVDSTTDTITIQAQAANSYQALDIFKKTIDGTTIKFGDTASIQTEALASQISTTDVTYGEDSTGTKVLRFTLSFVYSQDLFSPQSVNLAVIPATSGNVTDSYLGLPQTLFVDRAKDVGGN